MKKPLIRGGRCWICHYAGGAGYGNGFVYGAVLIGRGSYCSGRRTSGAAGGLLWNFTEARSHPPGRWGPCGRRGWLFAAAAAAPSTRSPLPATLWGKRTVYSSPRVITTVCSRGAAPSMIGVEGGRSALFVLAFLADDDFCRLLSYAFDKRFCNI